VRTVRWCRRNPIAAALLATASLGLCVVTALAMELGAKEALASQRLEQFQAMKVERDVRLLKRALDDAPGPWPEHAAALHELVATADRLVAGLPMLRGVLADLRRSGTAGGAIDRRRLLTEHPAAATIERLRRDRHAIAAWMEELARDGRVSEAWQASVRTRLAAMDARATNLEAEVATRRCFTFPAIDLEYLHDSVEDQIAEIEWLTANRLPALRTRASQATAAGVAPTGALAEAWAACGREAAANPKYGGLVLTTQPGLVPLGADPDSGLLEFAHAASGKIPARGAKGRLQCDADSSIVFVLVPGAEVWVGAQRTDADAPGYDPHALAIEGPPRQVRLAPFLLAKHELGHAQWNRLAEGLGIWHHCARYEGRDGFERKPITRVTWTACDRLCRAHGFVLPTEAQWDHACRAGTDSPWWTGATPDTVRGRENVRASQAGGRVQPGGRVAIDEGAPNPFGFFQMHGNVQEWCADDLIERDWHLEPGDGRRRGAVDGEHMAVRGGSYMVEAPSARTSKRDTLFRLDQREILGMRPALPLHIPR
ncbi:MAG: SUMF1/EgtB/PvdO family nonheme iron enzyme, partial [Planctomycetota bacterium]